MITRRMALSIVAIVILTSIVVYSADAAGIPKKAISTVSTFLKSDLPATTVFNDQANTMTGANTFNHGVNSIMHTNTGVIVANPAGSFSTTLAGGAVAANRTLNIPVITGTDTLATLGLVQTFTGALTINSLILGGDVNVGSNGLTTSGHKGTLPANTGTFLYTNGSLSSLTGTLASSIGVTTLSNVGHASTFPSNTGTILQANGSLSSLTGNLNSVGGTFTGTLSGGTLSGSISGTPTLTGRNMFTGGALINGTTVTMVTKTSSYTATATDDVIYVDATTTNPTTITLPSATTIGKIFTIVKKDSTTSEVTIKSNGGTVAGNTTRQLQNAGDTLQVISDGTNWIGVDSGVSDATSYHTKGSSKNRYMTEAVNQGAATTQAASANVLNVFPLIVPRTITIDSIEYEISTGVSGLCRVGIYTDNGTSYPYALVANTDIGTRGSGNTGMKINATASTVTLLGNNLYWVGYNCGAAPTFRSVPVGSLANVLGISTTSGAGHQGTGWTVAQAFGALPATYPAGGTVLDNTPAPIIGLRIKG